MQACFGPPTPRTGLGQQKTLLLSRVFPSVTEPCEGPRSDSVIRGTLLPFHN